MEILFYTYVMSTIEYDDLELIRHDLQYYYEQIFTWKLDVILFTAKAIIHKWGFGAHWKIDDSLVETEFLHYVLINMSCGYFFL